MSEMPGNATKPPPPGEKRPTLEKIGKVILFLIVGAIALAVLLAGTCMLIFR